MLCFTGLRQARAPRGARVGAAQARAKPPKKSAAPETEQEPNDETTIRIFVRKERKKKTKTGMIAICSGVQFVCLGLSS